MSDAIKALDDLENLLRAKARKWVWIVRVGLWLVVASLVGVSASLESAARAQHRLVLIRAILVQSPPDQDPAVTRAEILAVINQK